MKFVDDAAVDELAKSSTILQCMVHMLDFECAKFHVQAELIMAEDGKALINCDPMDQQQIMSACEKVNRSFVRKDKNLSCVLNEMNRTMVTCRAGKLEDYNQLA